MKQLLQCIQNSRVFDLAQPWFTGMPHHPSHPPFLFSLTKKQVSEIAKKKFNDLNARDVDHAARIIEGTARSMGIVVVEG